MMADRTCMTNWRSNAQNHGDRSAGILDVDALVAHGGTGRSPAYVLGLNIAGMPVEDGYFSSSLR